MEVETAIALDEQADIQRCCADRFWAVTDAVALVPVSVKKRGDRERSETVSDVWPKRAEDFIREESVQRLRNLLRTILNFGR